VKGDTFKRSGVETRGRKQLWSAANLTTMDRKRDELIVKVDVDREVTWDEVNRKLRVPKGDVSTAATRMKQASGIKRRTPRFKPAPLLKRRQEVTAVSRTDAARGFPKSR